MKAKIMGGWWRWLGIICVVLLVAPIVFCALGSLMAPKIDMRNPQPTVELIRRRYRLPALGMAYMSEEAEPMIVTCGVRKSGDTTAVTNDDLWHLGSCGKAMTATMIARLVERGVLRWDQSLAETFPDLATQMKDPFGKITLEQLLSHRAGIDVNFDLIKYVNRHDLTVARRDVLIDAMNLDLRSTPGTKYLYSNWGYTIAAAMAEQASGKDYETLMREELFQPLGMDSAGFGGIGTVGQIDQPWPHNASGRPMENGPKMDNPPVMAPAGTIHMKLVDWSKFVREHLRGPHGKSQVLTSESFKKLHTAQLDEYGMGWIIVERSWGKGQVITHAGDNTMNYAVVWAAPNTGKAVLVVTNHSSAQAACDALATTVILNSQ